MFAISLGNVTGYAMSYVTSYATGQKLLTDYATSYVTDPKLHFFSRGDSICLQLKYK